MLDRIDMHIRVPSVTLIGNAEQHAGKPEPALAAGSDIPANSALHIDTCAEFPTAPPDGIAAGSPDNRLSTADMKEHVQKAVEKQKARYIGTGITYNSALTEKQVKQYCRMTPEAENFMEQAFNKFGFSMRTYYKMLKVARTIADLDDTLPAAAVAAAASGSLLYSNTISTDDLIQLRHVAEAVRYRALDDFYRRSGDGR